MSELQDMDESHYYMITQLDAKRLPRQLTEELSNGKGKEK